MLFQSQTDTSGYLKLDLILNPAKAFAWTQLD